MQYVYDEDGRKHLDAFGNVVTISVGHCHPEVVAAVQAQMARLQHTSTIHLTEPIVLASEALARITPWPEDAQMFWVNSGGEANDFAWHLAKLKTGNQAMLAMAHSFHGRTGRAAALTMQQAWRAHTGPHQSDVYMVPNPYVYRRPDGMSVDGFYNWCLHQTREVIRHACGNRVAALFLEPMQGNGGVIYGPDWYYDALVDMVHNAGGLFVADEVQTGLYRVGGSYAFGCMRWSKKPDMLTSAKGLGNGNPVGVVVAPASVASAFNGLAHFNTYGGNPPSMINVLKVLEIAGRDETRRNINEQGQGLLEGLRELQERHPFIGDVRGSDLMIGCELVTDRTSKEPATAKTAKLLQLCRERGVLIGKGGVDSNVLRIKPPYCITQDDSDAIIGALDESLTELEAAA